MAERLLRPVTDRGIRLYSNLRTGLVRGGGWSAGASGMGRRGGGGRSLRQAGSRIGDRGNACRRGGGCRLEVRGGVDFLDDNYVPICLILAK
eukprot:1214986-Amorphochlora_amoeboformis.AAC.1